MGRLVFLAIVLGLLAGRGAYIVEDQEVQRANAESSFRDLSAAIDHLGRPGPEPESTPEQQTSLIVPVLVGGGVALFVLIAGAGVETMRPAAKRDDRAKLARRLRE